MMTRCSTLPASSCDVVERVNRVTQSEGVAPLDRLAIDASLSPKFPEVEGSSVNGLCADG